MDCTHSLMQEKFQQSTAKTIVLRHKITKDTRAIYAEIDRILSTSTASKLQLQKYTSYLATARILTGGWRGTQQNFILHFLETIRMHQELAGQANYFTPRQLIKFLHAVV